MGVIPTWNLRSIGISLSPVITINSFYSSCSNYKLSWRVWPHPLPFHSIKSFRIHAKKKDSSMEPVLKPTIIEEVIMDEEEEEYLLDKFKDASVDDEDEEEYFEDDYYEEDDAKLYAGDGGGGGGVVLAGTWWDKNALAIAEEAIMSFDGGLKIYAFKTLSNSTIQIRIEKLSNKSGSPGMEDIQAFSTAYRTLLEEAEVSKSVPENLSLEVSSPGVERVVRIPDELGRFKEQPMYVKYVDEPGSSSESEGVFRLVSFDIETKCCTWGLADVKINREKAGKGRPLNKKQRDWRLNTTFDCLCLVRLYSDI